LLSWSRTGAWRSLVSALVWGTRGPEFKSRRPDRKPAGNGGFLFGESEAVAFRVYKIGLCVYS
jgi:hypothetical protein